MRTFLAALVSFLAAVAIQPVVLFCWALIPYLVLGADLPWDQVGLMCLMAAIFSIPFVLLLGVPLTLLLQRSGHLKWWPLALAGAAAGAIFAGWSGPGSDPGFSSGGNWYGKPVDFVVNGEPTFYGWLSYLRSVAAFALHGLAGATAFYLVWVRSMGPNNSFKPNPLRGSA
jgi:hypothetical protein